MSNGKPAMCFSTACVKLQLVKRLRRKTKLEAIALCFRPLLGHGAIVESSRAIAFCVSVSGHTIGKANGRMSSPHPLKRCAYSQASARACSRYLRNRAFEVMTFSPRNGRSGNRRLTFWWCSPNSRMAQVGDITRLACVLPTEKAAS